MNPRRKFGGSGMMLVSLPLMIFVTLIRLSVNAEGAKPSNEWGIKEAQDIVGRYIKEAGGPWLMDLTQSNSGPLTMTDLLKAILRDKSEKDPVWQAATILDNALKSKSSIGAELESNAGLIDNWNDLIAKIETEDDIICLYRKNSNETAKRAEDWKKFLKTVSPGYTIHFAIDAGRKYIICLKKIEIIETTAAEVVTEGQTTSSTVQEITPATMKQIVEDRASRMMSPIVEGPLNDADVSGSNESDELCERKERYGPKDYEDGISGFENDPDIANKNGYDTNPNYEFSLFANRDRRQKIDKGVYDYSRPNVPEIDSGDFAHGTNCQRSILFVLPNRNEFSAYQRLPPSDSSAYRNVRADSPPGFYNLPKFSASPASSFWTDAEKLRKVNFNYGQPYRSAGVYQSGISKMINYGREMSLPRRKAEPLARRTIQTIQTRNSRLKMLDPMSWPTDNILERSNRNEHPKYSRERSEYFRKLISPAKMMKSSPRLIPGSSAVDPRISEQSNRNTNVYSSGLDRQKDQKFMIHPRRFEPSIFRPERPWVDHRPPSRSVQIGNGASSVKALSSSAGNYDFIDSKLNDLSRSRQKSRSSPCGNSKATYQKVNNPGRLINPTIFNALCRNSAERFDPVCTDKLMKNFCSKDVVQSSKGRPFAKLCERPIKLKIVINGRVRDPLRIAVLSDVGNKLEIDGSSDRETAYEFEEPENDLRVPNGFGGFEEIGSEPEIGLRMDLENASKEGSPKTNATDASSDLEDEKKSTNGSAIESTSIGSNITSQHDSETEQKILDTTMPVKFRMEPNVTMSTTTINSTTVV